MKQHVTTFRQEATGAYLITCDACAFRRRGEMDRNAAHQMAYDHTVNPDS